MRSGRSERGPLTAAERRRLAEVFGDVLPEGTADENDDTSPADADRTRDAEIARDVPPHHVG